MPDCKACKDSRMKNPVSVSYIVYESDMARLERTIKRLWIMCMTLIVLLVGSNCAWLWHESQFEDVVITQENADGYNNYIGNDGDIYNGETDD